MSRFIPLATLAALLAAGLPLAPSWVSAARADGGMTLEVRDNAPAASRSSRDVAGTWNGKYFYRDEPLPPVEFQAVLTLNGASLGGRITEPDTLGDQTVGVLNASIVGGKADEDGTIRFIKTYDGTDKVNHSVEYEGIYSPDGTTISGTWTRYRSYLGGLWKRKLRTGPFEMHRAR